MAQRNLRVIIPENADELIALSGNIVEKHNADGNNSPLEIFDMDDMEVKTGSAEQQHELTQELSRDAETATEERNLALGLAKDQQTATPGTVLFYATSIRDLLLGIYKGKEHKLGDWGYEVDDSPRTGVSVDVPVKVNDLIVLAQNIIEKHKADGANSVLSGLDMDDMEVKTTLADEKNDLSAKLSRDSETATETRNLALGHGKAQKTTTPGTILFYVTSIRDTLLGLYRGREHLLGDWGFEVDTSGAGSGNGEPEPHAISLITDQSTLKKVTIGLNGAPGDAITINWGDDNTTALTLDANTQNFEHDYATPGNYTITISGKTESITEFFAMNCNITTAEFAGSLTALNTLNLYDNRLSIITIPGTMVNLRLVTFVKNDLDEESVNGVLTVIDSFGTSPAGGQIGLNQGTNASPTGDGLIARDNLVSRGWTVIVN